MIPKQARTEKVAEFLRIHAGLWYCDACVSESAEVDAYYVAQITRLLASNSDYQRGLQHEMPALRQISKMHTYGEKIDANEEQSGWRDSSTPLPLRLHLARRPALLRNLPLRAGVGVAQSASGRFFASQRKARAAGSCH